MQHFIGKEFEVAEAVRSQFNGAEKVKVYDNRVEDDKRITVLEAQGQFVELSAQDVDEYVADSRLKEVK